MAWNPNEKPRLMNFRDWVPDPLRVILYLVLVCVFQFSNGMYFTAFAQMQGSLSLTQNDVAMMGRAVLIGLTMYFPLAFRLKFYFTNRTSLLIAATGQCFCNLIFPHIESFPLMLLICFLGGFFRLYGTFECFSNLLPKITPTYNYAVFLSFVFWIVLGFINVFDIISTHIIYDFGWHYVHNAAICLTLGAAMLILIFMRPFRPKEKAPLAGIDWLGFVVWSVFILTSIFVVQYGKQLGWLESPFIRAGMGVATACLAFGVWSMFHKPDAYIRTGAFGLKKFWPVLLLFVFLDIMLATQTVLQNTVATSILHLDQLNSADLKWFDFIGQTLGAIFCWWALTKAGISRKTVLVISFSAVTVYTFLMTQVVSNAMTEAYLYGPLILAGFGHVGVFIVLTVYAQATANFQYYFQTLCLLGFVRTGIGGPIGDALLSTGMTGLMNLRPDLELTIRELYGYTTMLGAAVTCMILCSMIRIRRGRRNI